MQAFLFSKAASLSEKKRHDLSGESVSAVLTLNGFWAFLKLGDIDVQYVSRRHRPADAENDAGNICDAEGFLASVANRIS